MTPTIDSLVRELKGLLTPENVLSDRSDLIAYECDGYTIAKALPDAVVFPRSTAQVVAVVRACGRAGVPIVPRGAATSLAGGCLPVGGGIVLMLTRMRRILKIDVESRLAHVETGVPNIVLGRALAGTGFHYAPDPSSQGASTIGGNIATNAGGPHTLKYGVTLNHVVGLEAVLADGTIVTVEPIPDPAGLDLVGLLVGSEGTLAVITKAWLKLTPDPQDYRTLRAIFESVDDASSAVSDVIGAGLIPAAMELMDQGIVEVVEQAYGFGFPKDAGAVVIIELDGPSVALDSQQERILEICRRWHTREVQSATTPAERELLWKCRKTAVGAVGRLAPSYCIQDGVVPRTRLPELMAAVVRISAEFRIRIVNVAHAGDGNVHPILVFDERDADQVARVVKAGEAILEECIRLGGSITAEHGIGVEKLALMTRQFSPSSLEAHGHIRSSFDPTELLNRGKVLPSPKVESGR